MEQQLYKIPKIIHQQYNNGFTQSVFYRIRIYRNGHGLIPRRHLRALQFRSRHGSPTRHHRHGPLPHSGQRHHRQCPGLHVQLLHRSHRQHRADLTLDAYQGASLAQDTRLRRKEGLLAGSLLFPPNLRHGHIHLPRHPARQRVGRAAMVYGRQILAIHHRGLLSLSLQVETMA